MAAVEVNVFRKGRPRGKWFIYGDDLMGRDVFMGESAQSESSQRGQQDGHYN